MLGACGARPCFPGLPFPLLVLIPTSASAGIARARASRQAGEQATGTPGRQSARHPKSCTGLADVAQPFTPVSTQLNYVKRSGRTPLCRCAVPARTLAPSFVLSTSLPCGQLHTTQGLRCQRGTFVVAVSRSSPRTRASLAFVQDLVCNSSRQPVIALG